MTAPGGRVTLLIALAVGVQAGLFTCSQVDAWDDALNARAKLEAPDAGREFFDIEYDAHRSLSLLASRIPDDARVLLIARTSYPLRYDFYFLPRPFHLLQHVDEGLLALVVRQDPKSVDIYRQWYDELERRELRLTPQRLTRQLHAVDWVVTFPEEYVPQDRHPRLRPVFEHGLARLYRVERDEPR